MLDRPRNFSKSANRALEILDYLAAAGAPSRAAEIADALGVARSSADQLLKTMVAGGYLVFSPQDKSYVPSPRLARFGSWISAYYPRHARMRDLVQEVHGDTGDIVTLTLLNDCYMQIIEVARGGPEDPGLTVGARVPVVGSAIGGAALTTKTRQEIRRIVTRARRQRAVIDDVDGMARLIERVRIFRMMGYSTRGHRFAGAYRDPARGADYWSIGVSVPSGDGQCVVLGLSGPAEEVRPRERRIADLMQGAIQRHLAS